MGCSGVTCTGMIWNEVGGDRSWRLENAAALQRLQTRAHVDEWQRQKQDVAVTGK